MFPQVVKVRSGPRTYEYLRILESYREGGVSKHRVIANLGRVDELDGKLEALVQSLSKYCQERLVAPSQVSCESAVPWGPILRWRATSTTSWGWARLCESIARAGASST